MNSAWQFIYDQLTLHPEAARLGERRAVTAKLAQAIGDGLLAGKWAGLDETAIVAAALREMTEMDKESAP